MLDLIGSSLTVFVFLALLVIFVLFKTALVVPNQQAVVVERLGKFHAVLFAGFHILIPFIDAVAYRRSLKEDVLDVPKQTCITKDNVSVDIDGVLYLQVVNPEKSAYGISDYMFGSVQLAQTALRSAIGKLELDRTFEERSTINQEVISALDAATASRCCGTRSVTSRRLPGSCRRWKSRCAPNVKSARSSRSPRARCRPGSIWRKALRPPPSPNPKASCRR